METGKRITNAVLKRKLQKKSDQNPLDFPIIPHIIVLLDE
jgi:hypothetical protein